MNYRKESAKTITCHQVRFDTPSNIVTFPPLQTNFLQYPAYKLTYYVQWALSAYNTMAIVCLLVDCTRCSEYFVQLFEAWKWLGCMLAWVRLFVTSTTLMCVKVQNNNNNKKKLWIWPSKCILERFSHWFIFWSTEMACMMFDEKRSRVRGKGDRRTMLRYGLFLENSCPRTRPSLQFSVCEVRTLAGMSGLVIVLDGTCACQWKRRWTLHEENKQLERLTQLFRSLHLASIWRAKRKSCLSNNKALSSISVWLCIDLAWVILSCRAPSEESTLWWKIQSFQSANNFALVSC